MVERIHLQGCLYLQIIHKMSGKELQVSFRRFCKQNLPKELGICVKRKRCRRSIAAAQGLRQLQKTVQEGGNTANTYSAEYLMPKIKLWHVAGNIAEVKRLQTLL